MYGWSFGRYAYPVKKISKKKKGRQGRSAASRRRAEENRKAFRKNCPVTTDLQSLCNECGASRIVFDQEHGDRVCAECGFVKDEKFVDSACDGALSKSKKYKREVYLNQRLAKLTYRDPKIDKVSVTVIGDVLFARDIEHKTNSWVTGLRSGRKEISRICKEKKLNPKLADGWIQIRKKLNYGPFVPELEDELLLRVRYRFKIVNDVFEELLHLGGDDTKISPLQRKNIVNLNYTIAQLFRLEDEGIFTNIAKFIPQLSDSKQPGLNNTRWKLIIDRIVALKRFSYTHPSKMLTYVFEWKYIRLTCSDIEKYFNFFY